MHIVTPKVALLQVTPNAEILIEQAGRTAYRSEDRITTGSASKFVKMIIKRGHESVLEHASATFRFITDRGVTHEMIRHRIAAYTQMSTRYCNLSGDSIGFVEPPELGAYGNAYNIWINACIEAELTYNQLIKAGCSPQIARSVLPNCLETHIVMTANLREWRHVFSLRCSKAAHPQIREIMQLARRALYLECPSVFEDQMGEK